MKRPPRQQNATPVTHAFETLRQALDRNEARARVLSQRLPNIARELEACDGDEYRCGKTYCAVCGLEQRLQVVPDIWAAAAANKGPHRVVTIYLDAIDPGKLHEVDIAKMHDALRQRFNRADFKHAILIGGTEAGWIASQDKWILHVHLLALKTSPTDWTRLRARLPPVDAAIQLKNQPYRNPGKQGSYIFKFVTYHRPGEQFANRRPKPKPLPLARLAELVQWWAKYRFQDFLFLYGAQWRKQHVHLTR